MMHLMYLLVVWAVVWGAIYYLIHLILILMGNPTRDEPYKPMTPEKPPPPEEARRQRGPTCRQGSPV